MFFTQKSIRNTNITTYIIESIAEAAVKWPSLIEKEGGRVYVYRVSMKPSHSLPSAVYRDQVCLLLLLLRVNRVSGLDMNRHTPHSAVTCLLAPHTRSTNRLMASLRMTIECLQKWALSLRRYNLLYELLQYRHGNCVVPWPAQIQYQSCADFLHLLLYAHV